MSCQDPLGRMQQVTFQQTEMARSTGSNLHTWSPSFAMKTMRHKPIKRNETQRDDTRIPGLECAADSPDDPLMGTPPLSRLVKAAEGACAHFPGKPGFRCTFQAGSALFAATNRGDSGCDATASGTSAALLALVDRKAPSAHCTRESSSGRRLPQTRPATSNGTRQTPTKAPWLAPPSACRFALVGECPTSCG